MDKCKIEVELFPTAVCEGKLKRYNWRLLKCSSNKWTVIKNGYAPTPYEAYQAAGREFCKARIEAQPD